MTQCRKLNTKKKTEYGEHFLIIKLTKAENNILTPIYKIIFKYLHFR